MRHPPISMGNSKLDNILASYLSGLQSISIKHNKLAILFSGGPGSGKTTIAKVLERELAGVYINSDDILRKVKLELTEQTKLSNQQLLIRFGELLMDYLERKPNKLIILDAPIDRTYQLVSPALKKYGYNAFVIRLEYPKEVLRERIIKRGGDINFALGYLDKMYDDFLTSLPQFESVYTISENNDHDLTALISKLKNIVGKAGA